MASRREPQPLSSEEIKRRQEAWDRAEAMAEVGMSDLWVECANAYKTSYGGPPPVEIMFGLILFILTETASRLGMSNESHIEILEEYLENAREGGAK